MLKKSQQEDSRQSTNRNKLPLESGIRSLAGIKELLALAEASKGSQIELSWTTKKPDQIFVLDVQWDASQKDPFWSLYEENAKQSKRLWAQPFPVDNIEMFYDVLVMSCGAVDASKNLSEILKAKPDKEELSKYLSNKNSASVGAEPKPSSNVDSNQQAAVNTNANSTTNPGTNTGSSVSASPSPGTSPSSVPIPTFDPNTGFMPVYPLPPGGVMPVNPMVGMPMPPYNMPPNMQPSMQPIPLPMPYPSNPNQPNIAFPGVPGMPGWQQYSTLPGSNPYFKDSPALGQPAAGSLNAMPLDASLLNKQSDIALVDLLIKAELLIEPVLAAALKMQELVQEKKISAEAAVEILKVHHNKGDAISEYLDTKKVKSNDKDPLDVFELLVKAGLLSAKDIESARGVSRKHGGNIVSILTAAQKLDANTLEAAKICHALEKSGLMKLEKCVMALNYCSRSRVTFDEAISELGWENPRHLLK